MTSFLTIDKVNIGDELVMYNKEGRVSFLNYVGIVDKLNKNSASLRLVSDAEEYMEVLDANTPKSKRTYKLRSSPYELLANGCHDKPLKLTLTVHGVLKWSSGRFRKYTPDTRFVQM